MNDATSNNGCGLPNGASSFSHTTKIVLKNKTHKTRACFQLLTFINSTVYKASTALSSLSLSFLQQFIPYQKKHKTAWIITTWNLWIFNNFLISSYKRFLFWESPGTCSFFYFNLSYVHQYLFSGIQKSLIHTSSI